MKFISWNVNGLRACMDKGFMDFFNAVDADVVCLQETKMQPEQASFEFPGYEQYWNSAVKKGYSGTAVFTRIKPLGVKYGLGLSEHDQEGRVITMEYADFYLVNVYTPNSKKELARLDYRMVWDDEFRKHLLALEAKKPVVLCGDLNVAHTEIDLKNPKTNTKSAGFTIEERAKLSELLAEGFIDSFRYLYPEQREAYTWWSYMFQARSKNAGWRIDYFIVSDKWRERITDSLIYADILGSDHCPVGLIIK